MLPERDDPPVLILCDWAEVINGKLYIQGGCWTRTGADTPTVMAIAVVWSVPWAQANQRHRVTITLVNEDGEPVKDSAENPLKIEGEMEVGRPPGAKQGAPLAAPIAIKFPGLVLPPGGYRFELHINGSLEATAPFQAVGGQI